MYALVSTLNRGHPPCFERRFLYVPECAIIEAICAGFSPGRLPAPFLTLIIWRPLLDQPGRRLETFELISSAITEALWTVFTLNLNFLAF